MGKYFIYQSHSDGKETLYKNNLSYEEADEAFRSLNSLIESGCCGDGCAVQGCLDREDDFFVAQRLGLIDKSFKSWDDYMEVMENVASDLCLRAEHESMYGLEND